MNANLKNWTGTIFVAVIAGFVIFGLLRGQEILNKFLKLKPTDANLESGEILEQIQIQESKPAIKPLPSPTLLLNLAPNKTMTPSPTPIFTPASTYLLTPNLTPTPSLNPTFTPIFTATPVFTPTPAPSQTSTPSPVFTVTPTPEPQQIPQESKININTANKSELEKITGVGPVIAQRIIDYRNENGPFQKIEDIKNVNGIGDITFEKMKDEITIID